MNNEKALVALAVFNDAAKALRDSIAALANDDITRLCKAAVALRDVKDETSEALDVIKAAYHTLVTERLPAALEKSEMHSVNIEGHTFSRSEKLFASIPQNKLDEGFKWLREHGLGDVIKEQVNPKTLSSVIKTLAKSED